MNDEYQWVNRWPQRVIDSLGREPQVGDWYCACCIHDFRQIDQQDLADLLEGYDDEDMDDWGYFWKTESEGRAWLAATGRDAGEKP